MQNPYAGLHDAALATAAARRWADERLKEGVAPGALATAMLSVAVSTGLAQDGPHVWAEILRRMADTLEQGGIVPAGRH
jgi:hypothetical protein